MKMSESLRKTFKYKLKPTPEQERELERVLGLCCRLYNVALEHRKTAYERRRAGHQRGDVRGQAGRWTSGKGASRHAARHALFCPASPHLHPVALGEVRVGAGSTEVHHISWG